MTTVIFDLDGTVANSLCDLANAVNHGLRELGYPERPLESFKKMVGNGAMKLCERALPDDNKDDTEKLHALFKAYYGEHYLDNTVAYEGVPELIAQLMASGANVAVATNKPQDVAVKVVKSLIPEELTENMVILGGCDERPKKPDPAIIHAILEQFPESGIVYMVGDSNVDMQTAKNAGIVSIGVLWGFRSKEELIAEGAWHIAEKAEDIAKIILG